MGTFLVNYSNINSSANTWIGNYSISNLKTKKLINFENNLYGKIGKFT